MSDTEDKTESDKQDTPARRRAQENRLSQTQELKAITLDPNASPEARELASQVQEMRANSKALGVPTDILDQFANKALSSEIATQERLAAESEQEKKISE